MSKLRSSFKAFLISPFAASCYICVKKRLKINFWPCCAKPFIPKKVPYFLKFCTFSIENHQFFNKNSNMWLSSLVIRPDRFLWFSYLELLWRLIISTFSSGQKSMLILGKRVYCEWAQYIFIIFYRFQDQQETF